MDQTSPFYLNVLADPRQLYGTLSLNIQGSLVIRVTHLAVTFQIAILGILTNI